MGHSLFYWGVAKVYKYGIGVAAVDWDCVSEKKKNAIGKATDSIAARIRRRNGKVEPGLKTKGFFGLMRLLQKNGWNKADMRYWKQKGWTGKERPW